MKYFVIIEHIKLGRDMQSDYEADKCGSCRCEEIEEAYECECDCHIEIREKQKIVVEHHDLDQAEEKASSMCTLQIIGDSDIIDSGLAADQDKTGIIWTHSDTFKSYD